jgi:hypothetical protein
MEATTLLRGGGWINIQQYHEVRVAELLVNFSACW